MLENGRIMVWGNSEKNINLSVLCISLDEESVRAKFTVNCFMNKFGENL